jgi:Leu/Phe-tRNA-protein transferase
MFSWDKTGDRIAIVQMNAELRTAQLELLSAQCATDRLRLRFSIKDIARHAQRDVLHKALSSATALQRYYKEVASEVKDSDSLVESGG